MVKVDHFILATGVLLLLLCGETLGYRHPKLEIRKDKRKHFFIENFGFATGGQMNMEVTNFKLENGKTLDQETLTRMYFLLRITKINTAEYLDEEAGEYSCPDTSSPSGDYPPAQAIIQNWTSTPAHNIIVTSDTVGLYNLYFINCDSVPVSFDLKLVQYNLDSTIPGGKDYLPIGLSPLPTIYGVFAAVYFVTFFVWIFAFMRGPGKSVNKVHYLMSVLVVLKFLSLLFYAIEQHYEKYDGRPGGWEIAYYIFAVLDTLFFFVIITLIGTGWSFFKPFLSDKDKKIIMVVIPLQVLDNIAMVIVGATAPGSLGWFTWKDIFRLVDIICCGAILIPIIWSIKHLREASQIDGKAARNLQKLRLFRQFYLIVVSYIYFTRIIIYLLDATLQYDLEWLGAVFTELATLSFFLVVGYKFRPVQGNPYFNLEEEDAARLEEMRTADED